MPRAEIRRFVLIAFLCIAFFFLRSLKNHSDPKSDDARIAQLLANPGSKEARSWLEEAPKGSRLVGGGEKEFDQDAALKLVRELYSRGAIKVTAIDIVTDHDAQGHEVQYTDSLIIELPRDPALRRALFDVDKREVQEEFGPATEAGQRFFMMWWD